jgi:hypothetical protein
MKTTFVTAYMTIYDRPYQNKDITWRFTQFKKLCQTGIPLAVFCSRDCEEQFRNEILSEYSNVVLLEAIDLSETWTYKTYQKVAAEVEIELPNTRCEDKDTAEYLILMNAKTEYVTRAIDINPFHSTHFAWVDFNIFHVFVGQEKYASYLLNTLAKRTMAERFLTLPGCWGKEYVREGYLVNDICWRFCGGFFIGSAGRMFEIHNEYLTHFENFLRTHKKLVWEVNFWAYLELHHGLSVVWYSGDHNDSILRFDAELTSFNLSDLPSFSGIKYNYDDWGDYIPTSTAYVCHKGEHIINTRLVNYWLHPNGAYQINDPDRYIRTRNVGSKLVDGVPDKYREMVEEDDRLICNGGHIFGLEDIRLYNKTDGRIGYIATNINYSGTGRNRMVHGIYDLEYSVLRENEVLVPPDPNSWCEKNWTPLVRGGTEYFIYKWWPYEIGVLQEIDTSQRQLVIEISWKHSTPLFSKVRGSTPFIETPDGLLGVVHFSYEGHPRRYFHILVLLDKETLLPLRYSDYFVFRCISVEFCIGFSIETEQYKFWISNFDRDPEIITINKEDIPLLFDFIE